MMYQREDVTFEVGDRCLTATVLSPPQPELAARPGVVLTFASDRQSSLFAEPYCRLPEGLLEHGHRAASFDLPSHGGRIDEHGEGIAGFRTAVVSGADPFATFVQDGRALISLLIARRLAEPGRIVVSGVSRGGYCALRLLAADDRIAAATALAPVTDWCVLSEFAYDTERPEVRALQLIHFVKAMAGRGVYLTIGREDARVSTEACRTLYQELKAYDGTLVRLDLTDDPGHTMGQAAYQRGSQFLLDLLDRTGAPS